MTRPYHKLERMPMQFKFNPPFTPISNFLRTVHRRHLVMELGEDYIKFEVHDTYFEKKRPDRDIEKCVYKQKHLLEDAKPRIKTLHSMIYGAEMRGKWQHHYISELFDDLAIDQYIMKEFFPEYNERYHR